MNTRECSWHDTRVLEFFFWSLLHFFITYIKEETFWQPTFDDEVVVPELGYPDLAFDENDSILDVNPLEDGSESDALFLGGKGRRSWTTTTTTTSTATTSSSVSTMPFHNCGCHRIPLDAGDATRLLAPPTS